MKNTKLKRMITPGEWGGREGGQGYTQDFSYICQIANWQMHEYLLCYSVYPYLFIYFWLCWVFVAVCGLSLVAASGGYSSLRCAGFSLQWLLLLRSVGSVVVARGLNSCGAQAQ